MEAKTFTLTADHVKLLRRMYVSWCGDECGAPAVDPKRPYGNGDVEGDIHEILTGERIDHYQALNQSQRDAYFRLHTSTETALQIVLATGVMEPGDYRSPAYSARWERVESS